MNTKLKTSKAEGKSYIFVQMQSRRWRGLNEVPTSKGMKKGAHGGSLMVFLKEL